MKVKPLILFLCLPLAALAQLAIHDVTVINPRSGEVLRNVTVLVEGDRITRVGAAIDIPRRFKHVNGSRRYLMPGLWDCHVHLTKAGVESFPLFLANGVTSVRDMGSDPNEILAWRREIESGKLLGPRIKFSGRILESKANVDRMKREGGVEPVDRIRYPIANPEEARNAVAEQKRIGVDHLKVRSVADLETLKAFADAADNAGLKLTGHALAAPKEIIGKMQSVEHVIAYPPLDQMDEAERRQLFRDMSIAGTYMSTTWVNIDGSVLVNYERARALIEDTKGKLDPRRRYIKGYLLSDWKEQVEEKKDPEQAKMEGVLRAQLPSFVRDFRQMKEEGVHFLAGSDTAVTLIYPGFSMHEELEIYVKQFGFSPMEALRVATHNPAEFYGIEAAQGAILNGQVADMVLLDRNPLDDIRNTRSIRAVISRGRLLNRSKLNKMLRAVRQ